MKTHLINLYLDATLATGGWFLKQFGIISIANWSFNYLYSSVTLITSFYKLTLFFYLFFSWIRGSLSSAGWITRLLRGGRKIVPQLASEMFERLKTEGRIWKCQRGWIRKKCVLWNLSIMLKLKYHRWFNCLQMVKYYRRQVSS